jgi:phosphatidylglycerol:prolipoprotein diacylglycerol transferase
MTAALAYPLLAALGLVLSAFVWERVLDRSRVRAQPGFDAIFIGALFGMVVGAKLGYALAEGLWTASAPPGTVAFVLQAFGGKTITGGLLGAYLGVELAKRRVGYTQPTGDTFAVVAPLSLLLGRVGCLFGGCCTGVPMPEAPWTLADTHGVHRWPAVPVELAFNALFFAAAVAFTLRRKRTGSGSVLDGQLFHLYLIAYGLFRVAHEPLRDTPRIVLGHSGYQLIALALVLLGAVRFAQRHADRNRL